MIGTRLNDRYRLDAELGRGAMGVVYLGQDSLLNRRVAVKVVRAKRLTEAARQHVLHEARAVARLNHSNIAAVYDAGEAPGPEGEPTIPFIVMELVEGESLRQKPPQDLGETLALTGQICGALAHAHRQKVVHRDLKPENVLRADEGIVKLVDFGLARPVASRMTQEGRISGTVYYLAPELAMGEGFDGRADLYALGIMLYEWTTGTLPFTGIDPIAIISQHIHAPLVPARAHNDALPRSLDRLIGRLLSKNPLDRPETAAEVQSSLLHIRVGDSTDVATPSDGADLSLDRIVRGSFVGRERELAEARALWQKSISGQGQVLLVSGPAGVGKSRLVRELITQVRVAGYRAYTGNSYPDGGLPYAPVGQVLEQIFEHDLTGETDLPDFILADIVNLAPTLRLRFPDLDSTQPLNGKAEQFRLFENLYAFLGKLSAHAPLLLALEDIHWADAGSLAFFRHLARRARQQSLFLVATCRDYEPEVPVFLEDILADLGRERLVYRLPMEPLDREGARELLATIFSEDITEDFLDGIHRITEGNPFFIEEVCKSLIEGGLVYFRDGRWHRPAMDELEIPHTIRTTIQARCNKLSPEAQDVLRLAAILGREFDFDTLQKASGVVEETLIEGLEQARRAQLVEEANGGGQRFSFVHGLIQATLRESVSGLRRASLHRQAAEALSQLHPEDFEALAFHHAQAGEDDRAREYYTQAADRAARLYANEDAIRLYSSALELTPQNDGLRFDLLARRVRVQDVVAWRRPQLADAQAMLSLAEKLDDEVLRCDALLALADVYLVTEHARAREPAERAVAIAREMHDPVREGHALRRLGEQAHRAYDLARSRGALETAAARFRKAKMPAEAAACLSILSVVLSNLGLEEVAREAADEALAFSRKAGARRQEATSLRRLAIVYLDQKQYAQALLYAEAALEIHRELGDRAEECNDLNALGIILTKLGRPDPAEAHLRQSLEIAQAIGSVTAQLYAANNLIHFHFRPRGAYQAALEFIQDQLEQAIETDDEFRIGSLHRHQGDILAILGQYDQALDSYRVALPIASRLMGDRAWVGLQASIGRMLAELGRPSQARHELKAAMGRAESAEDPLARVHLLVSWAYLAVLDGRRAELRAGLRRAEQALSLLDDVPGVWLDVLGEALCLMTQLFLALSKGEDVNAHKALDHICRVMERAKDSPEVSSPEVFHYLHAQARQALGQTQEAHQALQQAHQRVLLVANLTEDEALRQSWLTGVRMNRAIMESWGETQWGA